MKLFKLRFILLGLLLCVFHVWCRTCNSDFTDPASSAYLADVVVEGRVSQLLDPTLGTNFNITVKIRRVRKGVNYLKDGKKTKTLLIGEFGEENLQSCVTNITKTSTKYYFFLKRTNSSEYYRISSFPVAVTKKVGRSIRKITCKGCGKPPVLRKIRVKNTKIGRKLQLRCRIKSARPAAVVLQWQKDGKVLKSNKKKGIQIRISKRFIRLRIKKASLADAGVYKCIATNAAGSAEQDAKVKVIPRKPSRKTTTAAPTTVPSRYKPCLPKDKDYCLNGGTCRVIVDMDLKTCSCHHNYRGKRCAMRNPVIRELEEISGQSTERDRTLAIIGIVIGILIFICIFILIYLVAKNRRVQFLKRRDEKRRLANSNSVGKTSPTYQKLSSTNVPIEPEIYKPGLLQRQNTINMETQTEETSFIPPNPNTNLNLYLSPMDNIYRNPPSQRNSRTRLSGVSISGEKPHSRRSSTDNDPSNIKHSDGHQGYGNDQSPSLQTTPKRKSRGSWKGNGDGIPRIRMMSDSGSDDEDVSFPSLHISEDEQSCVHHRDSVSSVKTASNNSDYGMENNCSNNNIEPRISVEIEGGVELNLSQTSSSKSLSATSSENVSHSSNNMSQSRRVSETLTWNERGSPEHFTQDDGPPIEDPRYIRRQSSDNIYDQYPNSFDLSSEMTALNDVRDNEPPIHV